MGEDNIKLGEGQIFIDGSPFVRAKGMETIYKLDEADEIEPDPDWPKENPLKRLTTEEVTIAMQMVGKTAERMIDVFLGISKAVIGLCREIDPRVVHLARYGRTHRIRKNNKHRAYKILEREAKR